MKTLKQAIKEARKRWGKDAWVEDRGWKAAHTKEERDAAREELKQVREQLRTIEKRKYELESIIHGYQYSVGSITDIGIMRVKGRGDTWDEAFAQAIKSVSSNRLL